MYDRPYKLINGIQNYAWGKLGGDSVIPSIAGISPEINTPYAEYWIGTHPTLPSRIIINEKEILLSEFIQSAPESILGNKVVEKFGKNLPYLLKVLSIRKALSIQTHPDKAAACALHKLSPDKYPDDNHKPEIAIANTGLKALVGLKNKTEIKEVITTYPKLGSVLGNQYKTSLNNGNKFSDADRSELYNSILFVDEEKLKTVISELLRELGKKRELNFIERIFISEYEEYGYDPGLLALFFFNLIHLEKGEAFFTPAGVPHAYLQGDIVECMATSDNVVRAGLTPKFKDIDTLVKILDIGFEAPAIMRPESNDIYVYETPANEFILSRVLPKKQISLALDTSEKVKTLLLLSGEMSLNLLENEYNYTKGDSLIIPASTGKFNINLSQDAELFIVDIP